MADVQAIRAGVRTGPQEMQRLMSPLELDLVAAFSVMRERVTEMLDRAIDEGWSPDRLISEVEEALR